MNKMKTNKEIFGECGQCGQTVYIDAFGGDDVIPTGYWDDDECCFLCDGCYTPEDEKWQD